MLLFQPGQCFIERHQTLVALGIRNQGWIEFNLPTSATPLFRAAAASVNNQYPSHRFRRSRKEMPSAVPMQGLAYIHEPDIGLMHKRRGLQGLSGLLVDSFAAARFRSSSYTSGNSCSAALGSPDSI